MTPNHATKKSGARYRYYMSCKDRERLGIPVVRVPASDIENIVIHQLRQRGHLAWDAPQPSREQMGAVTDKVVVHRSSIEIAMIDEHEKIIVPATLIRRSGEKRIAVQQSDNPNPRKDEALIKLIARAHQARKALSDPAIASVDEAAIRLGVSTPYFCVILRLGYLAPDITAAILDGLQPAHINRQYLARVNNLPVDGALSARCSGSPKKAHQTTIALDPMRS